MTLEPQEVTTTIAKLVRVRKDLIEINYTPGCVLVPEHMTEVQEARRRMMGKQPYGMLTIIPEDVDFDMGAMRMDHLAPDRSMGQVVATAVVARSNMIERLIHVYFKHFPQLHRILVTDKEDEARAWLATQMEEIANTGS
jgi:hypothetical protein